MLNKNNIIKLKKIVKNGDSIFFASGRVPAKNLYHLQNNIKMLNNLLISIKNKKIDYFLYINSDAVYKDTKKK